MKEILLVLFIFSIVLTAMVNRLRTYVKLLAFQGLVLFALSFIELDEITPANLAWISIETLLFKSVAVPWFLFHLINRNKITREAEPFLPHFASLIITVLIIAASYALTTLINDLNADRISFVTALSTLFFGLYFICSRRKILSHLIGYIIIENAVFILTLSIGNEMPLLVNLGVLLDIFASVLLMGFFAGKIGDVFKTDDISSITSLRD
ncbi:MAG: hypothetical protein HUJ89_03990 [Bacteroidales bacterium]|nr:hypothetical protein [Bacteroidales bacterium]